MKKVMKNIMEIGCETRWRAMEYISTHQVQFIVENGRTTSMKDEAFMSFQMVPFMMDSGKIANCMERESILIERVINGKGNLLKEFFKVRCKRY
jgi:hypothetical protein